MESEKHSPKTLPWLLTTYSFISMYVKHKQNSVKLMQHIPTKPEPDVRNNRPPRTPRSLPFDLHSNLCCSLLKNVCRLQVENDRKLPCVSLSFWAFKALCWVLAQKNPSAAVGSGEQKVPLEDLHLPKGQWGLSKSRDGSQFISPTKHCVSMRSPSLKPPGKRTPVWNK